MHAALGEAAPGLLEDGDGPGGFEYRGAADAAGAGSVTQGSTGEVPPLRWRMGLRVALLLGALAMAAGVWFWWQAGLASPEVLPLSGASSAGRTAVPAGADPGSTPPADPAGGLVVVHVAGSVATPGVIRLQQGSRVNDAIAAAGGAAPDADVNRLNLALVLADGQKIYVPRSGELVPAEPDAAGAEDPGTGATGAAGGQPGAHGGKVNLNTADAAELDTLPKVGPVLAQRIVDWRKDHGPFKSVEELDAVDGVGPKMLEALLPLVTV